jgi:hypothetical protein
MLRIAGLAALACAAQLSGQTPAGTVDGWKLVVRNTIDSGGVDHRHWTTSTMWIAGYLTRTEVSDPRLVGVVPSFTPATTVVNDSAHTMTFIVDRSRSASVTQLAATPQLGRWSDTTSRFITAPTMTMHDLGAGEPILGHPTHKYSVTISYVAQEPLMGLPCKRTVSSEETIWAATDLQREENLRQYVRDSRPLTNVDLGPVMDSLQRLHLHRERLVNGLILRSAITLTKPASGGAANPVTTTMEVIELTRGPIPKSMFVVPTGYTVLPTPRSAPNPAAESALKARLAERDSIVRERVRAAVCDQDPGK